MADSDSSEQRHFSRIPFDAQVAVGSGAAPTPAHLLDISLKGALVELPNGHGLAVGDRSRLEIALGAEQRIDMAVSVAHVEPGQVGFRCEHIDLESITHLARLVELNTGDPDLLQRELGALAAGSLKRRR